MFKNKLLQFFKLTNLIYGILAISNTRIFDLQTAPVQILILSQLLLSLVSIPLHSYIISLPSTTTDSKNEGIKVKTLTKKSYHDDHRHEYLNWINANRGLY